MTVRLFMKTVPEGTMIEIYFILTRENYTHKRTRNTNYLVMDGRVCFYRRHSYKPVEP